MTLCIIRKSYHCVIFVNTQLIQWVTNELRCSKWNKLLDTLHVLIAAPDIKSFSHTKQGGRGSPSPHHSPLWGPEFPLPPSKFFLLFFFLFFFVYFCCCCCRFLLFFFFFFFSKVRTPSQEMIGGRLISWYIPYTQNIQTTFFLSLAVWRHKEKKSASSYNQ